MRVPMSATGARPKKDTVASWSRYEPAAMKNKETKTRAGATTPGAEALDKGEQQSLELQSESQHQIGNPREKMISEAKEAAGETRDEDAAIEKG